MFEAARSQCRGVRDRSINYEETQKAEKAEKQEKQKSRKAEKQKKKTDAEVVWGLVNQYQLH